MLERQVAPPASVGGITSHMTLKAHEREPKSFPIWQDVEICGTFLLIYWVVAPKRLRMLKVPVNKVEYWHYGELVGKSGKAGTSTTVS